ncbi:MarR family transcriptional regulator [uncultured Alsobacter sp.]|uniref:MarR family winged helix-turn-helix transcriptional regulator n=1 Tax=uncultured Alsobacter sp. TaxID=1748258 RepID=UPI0025E77E72|nr:MarR family transcriptional regulator [uncultured Alsobacter sp.]
MATCYADTLRLAARKITARYDGALEPTGLTIAQFALLRKIRRAGEASLTDLGRRAGLDRSTIGRNVRVLEKAGLVAMAPGKDQREAAVALTKAGHERLAQAEPLWEQVQTEIEDVLGASGVKSLNRLADAF